MGNIRFMGRYKKLHIKKGDTVYVNSGEYKDQQGRVLQVIAKTNRAIVGVPFA